MTTLLYLLFLTVLMQLAQGDRIIVNEPIKRGRFRPNSIMKIDYTVRFEGMAKLGSASVSILYPNHTVITFLPEGNWMDSPDGRRGASASWVIPSDLEEGEYRLRISGPAVYMCSEKGNGQAPYTRCHTSIHRTRTFTVAMDGEDGMDQETETSQSDQDGIIQDDVTTEDEQTDLNIDINQDDVNIDIDQADNQDEQDMVGIDADADSQDTDAEVN